MIPAPILSLLAQATAANGVNPAPAIFYRRWEDAEVYIGVAQGRVCGRASRAREVARLQERLRDFEARARATFGEIDQIIPLLEPERPRPACDLYRPAAIYARRMMDDAEAFLDSVEASPR